MNEKVYESVKSQVESIIFNRELDNLSGYYLSFPDYINVIHDNQNLYKSELQTFINYAICNNLSIDKNTVGYDFLTERLGHLSYKYANQKKENIEDIIISPENQEISNKRKVGRPKGSKNIIKVNIPRHKIIDSQIIPAIQDLIWYRSGMLAKEIINQLDLDESIVKLAFGKLHEYSGTHWIKQKKKLPNGGICERYYPIKDRSGYFYDGKLMSLGEISKITGKSKQILSYRIKKGLNHIEAINNQINDKMIRRNPNKQ